MWSGLMCANTVYIVHVEQPQTTIGAGADGILNNRWQYLQSKSNVDNIYSTICTVIICLGMEIMDEMQTAEIYCPVLYFSSKHSSQMKLFDQLTN